VSDQPTLSQLDALTRFADRHIGPGEEEQRAMLEAEGVVFDPRGRIDLRRYRWEPKRSSVGPRKEVKR